MMAILVHFVSRVGVARSRDTYLDYLDSRYLKLTTPIELPRRCDYHEGFEAAIVRAPLPILKGEMS